MSKKEKKVIEIDVHYTTDKGNSHKYEGETDQPIYINVNARTGGAGAWLNKEMKELPDKVVFNFHHGIGAKAEEAKKNSKAKLKKKKDK